MVTKLLSSIYFFSEFPGVEWDAMFGNLDVSFLPARSPEKQIAFITA